MRCFTILVIAFLGLPAATAQGPDSGVVGFLISAGYQRNQRAGEITYEGIEVLRPQGELSRIAAPAHSLSQVDAVADRHRRLAVQLVGDDGIWVQENWLRAGGAILMHADMPDAVLERLRAAEGEARARRLGVWAFNTDSVINCHDFARTERYQVVQGRVVDVGFAAGNAFLNFGDNYRTDFTARIERADFARFGGKAALEALQDQVIEVRGWAYFRGGVMIDVFWPADLLTLEADDANRREACLN